MMVRFSSSPVRAHNVRKLLVHVLAFLRSAVIAQPHFAHVSNPDEGMTLLRVPRAPEACRE
jgi:hypothetical protein